MVHGSSLPKNPLMLVRSVNLFISNRFRTLCPQRSAPISFAINRLRTLSHATGGGGRSNRNLFKSSTCQRPLLTLSFQSLPQCFSRNLFLFNLLHRPGVGTLLASAGVKVSLGLPTQPANPSCFRRPYKIDSRSQGSGAFSTSSRCAPSAMTAGAGTRPNDKEKVRDHYDRMSPYYH